MNKLWVLQRDEVMGVDIGTKKQYVVQGWEFILSKIDSRNWAFWIVPASLKWAIITWDFLAYDINTELVDMDFFLAFISLNNFERICAQASSGTTNRQRLSEPKFLNFEIQIPATIWEQKEMMIKYAEYKKGFTELKNISDKNEKLIKSLRSSILQDAIQWKLVPQDPTDEPASILIEKIQAEKSKLIEEWKLKKQKLLPPIKPEEIPYELPKGWKWVRLGEILELVEYWTSEKAGLEVSQIPVLRMGNIQDGQVDFTELKYLDRKSKDIPKLYLKSKDLLFNRTNSFELVWKTAIFLEPDDTYTFAWYLIRLRVMRGLINAFYVNNYINSQIFRKTQIEPTIVQQCWQANYNGSKLVNTVFPLPPIKEQVRIVEKIDEFIQCCELLDKQVKQSKERSEKLMESVLQGVFNW